MSPRVRKLGLTLHVASSVGWLGAVIVVLALAIAGVTSDDAQTVRAVHIAMDAIGWAVLVPLSLASLVTGVVQALGTKWGLFRHYWVLFKLAINLVASIVLLLYMQTLAGLAELAARQSPAASVTHALRSPSPVLHAGLALILLLVATVLAVYKPRGVTAYGWRRQRDAASRDAA